MQHAPRRAMRVLRAIRVCIRALMVVCAANAFVC
jgi:hypothetical protein